jgi:hypothetical protein
MGYLTGTFMAAVAEWQARLFDAVHACEGLEGVYRVS